LADRGSGGSIDTGAEPPTQRVESASLSSNELDAKYREFGFDPPRRERWRWLPVARGGTVALRRWMVGWVILAVMALIALLYLLACGPTAVQTCGSAIPFAIAFVVLLFIFLGALWWFAVSVPALWESPRHPAVAGQFAAGQRTFPSQDVIFDPEYDNAPPR
jgi:hypothetical protein